MYIGFNEEIWKIYSANMKKQIETSVEEKKINVPTETRPKKYIFSLPANYGGFGDLIQTDEAKYNNVSNNVYFIVIVI